MVTVSRFPRKVTLHSFRVLCILFLIQEEIFIWINNIDTSSGQSHILNPLISDLFVVQLLSHVRLFETPWTAAHQASLSFTISRSLLKLLSIEWVMLSNHLILCHPLLLLPSIFPSIRVFSSASALRIRWPKYWNFSQHQSFQGVFRTDFLQDWLVWPLWSPRDSKESSLAPQFESINSLALSFLYRGLPW